MKVQLTRQAEVRGWMFARAVIRVEITPMTWDHSSGLIPICIPPQCIWLESQTPINKEDAKTINDTLSILVAKMNL